MTELVIKRETELTIDKWMIHVAVYTIPRLSFR